MARPRKAKPDWVEPTFVDVAEPVVEMVVEPVVEQTKKEVRVVYKNSLNGMLKVDDLIFTEGEEKELTEAQLSTRRMAHAIVCGVIVKCS